MKNHSIFRIMAFALVFVLIVCALGACGGKKASDAADNGSSPEKADAPKNGDSKVEGAEETWGNITVFVPEGMTLNGGNVLDKENPDVLTINLDENDTHYIMISVVSEETAKNSVDTTKEMNESSDPEDVSFDAGGKSWTGVAYKYAGMSDCFQVYAVDNGKYALVSGGWFAYNDAATTAILESVKLA